MSTSTKRLHLRPEDGTPLSSAIVEAVSTASDTPVEELPFLYDVVDPDALSMLFFEYETNGYVTFEYAGYVVTVHADRTIEVSEES